jgi:hypothetical protein
MINDTEIKAGMDLPMPFMKDDEVWKPGQNPFKQEDLIEEYKKNPIICKLHFECHRCNNLTPNCAYVELSNKKGNWVCFNCLTPEEKAMFLKENPNIVFEQKTLGEINA